MSVTNPIVSVTIGVFLFDERLSRPAWHVVVAVCGLALAMLGAVAISIAREKGGGETQSRRSRLARKPSDAVAEQCHGQQSDDHDRHLNRMAREPALGGGE